MILETGRYLARHSPASVPHYKRNLPIAQRFRFGESHKYGESGGDLLAITILMQSVPGKVLAENRRPQQTVVIGLTTEIMGATVESPFFGKERYFAPSGRLTG